MAEGFALYELLDDAQGNPADWRVLEVNDAYQEHTGIARDQIAGRRISELFPAAVQEYLPRFAQVVATQSPIEFETYAKVVNRHQRISTFPAGPHRFASIIEDISKRKLAEDNLHRAQNELLLELQQRTALEERQRLARELHDSVSQALYGISLGINTALVLFDSNRVKAREALDYALSGARRAVAENARPDLRAAPESLEMEGLVARCQGHACHATVSEVELSLRGAGRAAGGQRGTLSHLPRKPCRTRSSAGPTGWKSACSAERNRLEVGM